MAISAGTALLGGGLISGVGSLFGAGKGAKAATRAASIQAEAAKYAADLQFKMFNQIAGYMQPYREAGTEALGNLLPMLAPGGSLTTPVSTWGMTEFDPTMASLAKTPGYKFALQQGLQSETNAYASQGLAGSVTGRRAGPSGPLAAGLAKYATGLASETFNNQYQNWLSGQSLGLTERQQLFGFLGPSGLSGAGQAAAANLGTAGIATTSTAGNLLTSGAAASAGGVVGAANALNAGLSGVGNTASSTAMMFALLNSGMFGAQGGAAAAPTAPLGYGSNIASVVGY